MDLSGVPPIAFVVSGIVAITCINMVNRLAVKSIKTRWGIIAANYCVAFALSLAIFAINGFYSATLLTIGLGVVSGLLYIGGMYLGITTIGRRGASIAVSASQLSVLILVSLSIVIYGDSLGMTQLIGVGIALVSLPYSRRGGMDPTVARATGRLSPSLSCNCSYRVSPSSPRRCLSRPALVRRETHSS